MPPADSTAPSSPDSYREVRFRHSRQFVPILRELGASLLISTYQAGKLVVVGAQGDDLSISLHNFDQAMGLAPHPARLAVGSRGVIWFLQSAPELAPRLQPEGKYDTCYLARESFITGNIHGHEMAWCGDELWVVNTLFSCLVTLHPEFSFVPRWQPPFISQLEATDRCHLNGLAIDAGRPRFVTCMAATDTPGGWRPDKAHSGQLLDIASGQCVTQGLAMPHSPRVHAGRLWVLNSGLGSVELVDPASGHRDIVTKVPGYTRGLAFVDPYAFVGMSRIRETAVFGGVPIAEQRDQLRCGVAVIDLRSGQAVAYLEFESGVEEIFDVQTLPGAKSVSLTGPFPSQDDAQDIWVVPPPGTMPRADQPGGTSVGATITSTPVSNAGSENADDLLRRAQALAQQGQHADAVATLERAVGLRPRSADLHNHLGNAWQNLNRQEQALASYRRAIEVNASFAPAHQNLGYLLIQYGLLDEGLSHLRRAQQLEPRAVNRVMLATALPAIYHSTDDLHARWREMETQVQQLVDDGVSLDTTDSLVPTNFFAAYQGYNDRDLQRKLVSVYRAPAWPGRKGAARRDGRIRLGLLSAHFRDHTIGRLNLGRVEHLNREKFEVTVISRGHHQDAMAQQFRRAADQFVELSGSVAESRRQITELDLDLLLFADVGMDATTYTLAMSRMAAVQCVTWGHPATTGSQSMDYFLSSQLLEVPDADAHYTERLVRLANLGTYYYRPRRSAASRSKEFFGLDPARHAYLCPQSLFKIVPEFDEILGEILRRDPLGDVILLQSREHWTRLLQERFGRTIPDVADRVRFLPQQPNADFLELLAASDVLLDTIHFGGGNTSYEALALGKPIVTLPSQFLRGRITQALYRKMHFGDCIVHTAADYVELAVRLGVDADFRGAVSEKILATADVLFEDPAELRELERALAEMTNNVR